MIASISNFISNDYKTLKASDSVLEVQEFFEEVTFSHFPVLDSGIYLGSLAKEDAENFDTDKTLLEYRYTLEGFFARNTMNWLDVLEVFARNNTNTVPVLNQENEYLGYYELASIFKFFNETPFLKEQGTVVIIKKPIIDYSLSQIVQIVESNNAKLLGVFVSDTDVDSIQITLKISLGEMNAIIQTFRRYNYEIISEHDEDNYLINLKERSDYLTKYLNL